MDFVDGLKRAVRPLRPALLPVWRRVRPYTGRGIDGAWRAWRVERARARYRNAGLPIRPFTRQEFDQVAAGQSYYRGRWAYMSAAGDLAGDLILRHGLRTALELGPHVLPLIVGADVMDLRESPDLYGEHTIIVHDARTVPWPIAERRYDLFVALQVFEHLGDRQVDAFLEVRRVARHAIISLPIDWVMKDPTHSHHMISNELALSWFAPVVPTRIELGNGGPKKRLIYVFEELPPVPPTEPAEGVRGPIAASR